MRRGLLAALVFQGLLLGCSDLETTGFHGPGHGVPPPPHMPGKADLVRCTPDNCDQIAVNIQVDTQVVGKETTLVCTVRFLYQKVTVHGGLTARFGLAPLSTGYDFRFTDPTSMAVTGDLAAKRPGIDIDYGGGTAAFTVGYPNPTLIDKYEVTANSSASDPSINYPFVIHAEWSADHGATWSACLAKDPVIAND